MRFTYRGHKFALYAIDDPATRRHPLATHTVHLVDPAGQEPEIGEASRLIDGSWTIPGHHFTQSIESIAETLLHDHRMRVDPTYALGFALEAEKLP